MKDRIGRGSFFLDNIKDFIIQHCLNSNLPDDMFRNIKDMVSEIEDEIYEYETTPDEKGNYPNDYWEKQELKYFPK